MGGHFDALDRGIPPYPIRLGRYHRSGGAPGSGGRDPMLLEVYKINFASGIFSVKRPTKLSARAKFSPNTKSKDWRPRNE
jgi:hypothetical protein